MPMSGRSLFVPKLYRQWKVMVPFACFRACRAPIGWIFESVTKGPGWSSRSIWPRLGVGLVVMSGNGSFESGF